jgi:hypothetical protein
MQADEAGASSTQWQGLCCITLTRCTQGEGCSIPCVCQLKGWLQLAAAVLTSSAARGCCQTTLCSCSLSSVTLLLCLLLWWSLLLLLLPLLWICDGVTLLLLL